MEQNDKFRIVILTHGGCERLLELLSADDEIEVSAVYVENPKEAVRKFSEKLKRSMKYDGMLATVWKFFAIAARRRTEGGMEKDAANAEKDELIRFCRNKAINVTSVDRFNAADFKEVLSNKNADLGILYGTNIIRKSVFSIPRLGSINIHQGLAPFYRGGPTVFWELFNDEDEVGITVHFVAAKVDTGEIVLQETVPLFYDFDQYGIDYESFLEDFRASLVEPSARLMAAAVNAIARGKEVRTLQDTSLGKRYRLPVKKEKDQMLKRLKKRMQNT